MKILFEIAVAATIILVLYFLSLQLLGDKDKAAALTVILYIFYVPLDQIRDKLKE